MFGVLNNLSVQQSIEWQGVALVPGDDSRVKEIGTRQWAELEELLAV